MNLYDELLKIGVTQVTEKWHDLLVIELILEGDFKDEDVAKCLYQHSPVCYWNVGETTHIYEDEYGMLHRYGFTRGL
ncbi:hypothetical protein [Robertmurraya sp.]|uniref:hypothetical protein n=1 Tax=Robertmurraya sp. TaxID=2837525 RepID=UPI0037045F17